MNDPVDPKSRLDRTLAGIRRAWRLRRVLEGLAIAFAALLLGGLGVIAIMDHALFEPGVVSAARTGFYLLAAAALLTLVVPPVVRRASDAALARYVESKAPELDALVVSAVDARAAMDTDQVPSDTSPGLARRLIEHAAATCRTSPVISGLERARTRRAAGAAAGMVALAAALLMLAPDSWRHGAWLLLQPAQDPATAARPYSIRVAPGDASILAGDDLHIAATPDGFRPEALVLAARRDGESSWTRTRLSPSPDGSFETHLFDVVTALEYRVEHPALSSPGYRIEVIPRPVAERIDLRYEFPEYTGRAPELVRDGGDITAVRGTRVEVRVTPSLPTRGGRLVLDGERHVPLRAGGDGDLRARIEVADNGRYRVELAAGDYGMAPASPEHAIVAHEDALPTVELQQPGRDVRVTSIEELAIGARARDDVAVRDLELVLSVNGGPDEVVRLGGDAGPAPAVADRHELFLEERDLAPGDLIAYYVRASDAAGHPDRRVSSDIFFMDVRPFEMSYRRASGGGGGGGRAGAQNEEDLAAQQRSLVVALFKLLRDRMPMDEAVFAERLDTLGTAQERIRERVDAIVRRLGTRSIVERNPGYRRMAEELPQASKSMVKVEALLAASDIEEALPAARQALLHLQRADSAFREAQVAQSQQGGGGGDAAETDLANLFRLEMDRFRSPYEDAQRGDWAPPEQQIDDALRKLRELAERQQRELERTGVRGREPRGERQRALAEELEELARQLERLTRRQSSESLRASMKAIEEAARSLGGSGGEAKPDAGAEALERMREARRLLESDSTERLARDTEAARRRAERMADSQAGIERDVGRERLGETTEEGGARRLAERKQALAEEVEAMQSQLDRLARDAQRNRRPEAGETLERAAEALRENAVAERVRRSGERISREGDGGQPQEEAAISHALRGLQDRIASAAKGLDEPGDIRLSRLHDALRATVQTLERGAEQLADRARRGPAVSGSGPGADVDRADVAQAQRALEQRLEDIGGLADALAREPGVTGDLEALRRAIEAARAGEEADVNALRQRHAELLATLQGIEHGLRTRLDDQSPAAWGPDRSEPPPAQREIVETYYRNLSERTE